MIARDSFVLEMDCHKGIENSSNFPSSAGKQVGERERGVSAYVAIGNAIKERQLQVVWSEEINAEIHDKIKDNTITRINENHTSAIPAKSKSLATQILAIHFVESMH